MDWSAVRVAAQTGDLLRLLRTLPRERWTERDAHGATLLHYACEGPNVDAAKPLLAHGLDINARTKKSWAPVHTATDSLQPRMLEVLCALGADVMICTRLGSSPLYLAMRNLPDATQCVRVLVGNGVRLCTAEEGHRSLITPEMTAWERGVLRCRTVVVALLRVKRAGRLVRWDKFLLADMAVCTWATRYAHQWGA